MDARDLRRLALRNAFPRSAPLGAALAGSGFVQLDPIRAPARAQDLILRHRVPGYRAGDLERRYPRLGLEEAYFYAYGVMTPALRALLLPRHDPESSAGVYRPAGVALELLEFVRANGPTHPATLEEHFGSELAVNGWGGASKATTRLLDRLLHHGHVRVAKRQSGTRVFAAIDPPEPALSPHERLSRLALEAVRALAPVSAPTLTGALLPLVRATIGVGTPHETMAGLLAAGTVETGKLDGVRYYWTAEPQPEAPRGPVVRFLAPFDPLVWDRRRFEHLWGWAYRFEAYTPPERRQRGYYAMPLQWGDRVIGWVNVSRRDSRLDVQPGFVARRPDAAAFHRGFDSEVARLAAFLEG